MLRWAITILQRYRILRRKIIVKDCAFYNVSRLVESTVFYNVFMFSCAFFECARRCTGKGLNSLKRLCLQCCQWECNKHGFVPRFDSVLKQKKLPKRHGRFDVHLQAQHRRRAGTGGVAIFIYTCVSTYVHTAS